MSEIKVNNIVDASGGSTAQVNGFTPTISNMAGRNRIINGCMRIDQRNAGASATPSGYVTIDRFKVGNNTNTGTIQRITSTLAGFQNSVKYTASGSNTFFQFGQQIEFCNCADLQGKTVTISFRAKANNSNTGSTALVVRTRTGASVDSTVIFVASAVSTSVPLTTTDALYTVTRTLPATFGALSVEFALGSHVAGDGFEITGVQLEEGSVATPFCPAGGGSYGAELALCQRYYYRYLFNSLNHMSASGVNDSSSCYAQYTLPVEMRANVQSVDTTGTASDYRVWIGSTNVACSTVPAIYIGSTTGCSVKFNTAGLTVGTVGMQRANASGVFLGFNAEL